MPVTEKVTGIVTVVPTGAFSDVCGVDTAISGGVVAELVKFMLQSSGNVACISHVGNVYIASKYRLQH